MMMKKTFILVAGLLMCCASAFAQKRQLNDYSMVGVNYGVSFSMFRFTPNAKGQDLMFKPQYISIMYTSYGKFFNRYPYFGIQTGLAYGHEGYRLKSIDEHAEIKTLEVPVLAQFHADFSHAKLLANLGFYGGYRHEISRTDTSSTVCTYRKFDYGAQGGVGFSIIFDPVEIQFNGLVRFSMSPLFPPDTYSSRDFTYAYPLDFIITAGVHFHLGKRYGKTNKELKQEAREAVMKEYEDSKSTGRQ